MFKGARQFLQPWRAENVRFMMTVCALVCFLKVHDFDSSEVGNQGFDSLIKATVVVSFLALHTHLTH